MSASKQPANPLEEGGAAQNAGQQRNPDEEEKADADNLENQIAEIEKELDKNDKEKASRSMMVENDDTERMI